jgi:RNA polymerase sigma-70 factor (ECF subfamily)
VNADPANDRADFLLLQRDDEPALNRLIARWEQPLFAHAWRYLRNTADARDAVIEVFVRLHQQRARLRADTNLSAWLFTTLTNLCHNQHRWRRRHPAEVLDDVTPVGLAAAPTAEVERDEAVAALGTAIGHLPAELKTTVLLHHYQGWSYRQIAEVAHCSERGVETRLYRARQLLREELAPYLHEAAAGFDLNSRAGL